jgi:hypothetical protein
MFPQTPIGNIKANLSFVLEALTILSLADKQMVLMALSTIRAETASFEPISKGHPLDLYDNRKNLGNRGQPDGEISKVAALCS